MTQFSQKGLKGLPRGLLVLYRPPARGPHSGAGRSQRRTRPLLTVSAYYLPRATLREVHASSHQILKTTLQGRCHCPHVTNQDTRRWSHLMSLPGLEPQKWVASQSPGQMSETKVLAGLAPPEACLIGSRTAVLPLYLATCFSSMSICPCVKCPLLIRTPVI